MSRAKVVFNKIPAIQREIPVEMQAATIDAGEELVVVLQRALDDGCKGIESDTHALAKSLYVKATGRDDYGAALKSAREAYANNPSRHRNSPATEAALQGFDAIVADYDALAEKDEHVQTAAVATMLAYGNVWEFEREWMNPPAQEWAKARFGFVVKARLLAAYMKASR